MKSDSSHLVVCMLVFSRMFNHNNAMQRPACTAVDVYVTITCSAVIFILINMKRNKFIHHSLKKRLQSFHLLQCYFTSQQDTMQLSKIVQACDMGYLKGKGGRYVSKD